MCYQSLGRFDQQVSTKFHLDGGPAASYLMLGYEPSSVASTLALADYSRAAQDLGMQPREFLDRFNPMFPDGANRVAPYAVTLSWFDHRRPQIVVINNSSQSWVIPQGQLGVLHCGKIPVPDPSVSRVINSTLMVEYDPSTEPGDDFDMVRRFLETESIARSSYN
ncbi:MAG: hypothetical protein B7Z55_19420 [Planctomycetales bacterium 12-60-4]|nr:MAG: hypothetical protein B7Z55_19420 [Planctomycetales bacterium 12-60-4]